MSEQILGLITIFGLAVLIAIQGYVLVMLGRALSQPEERQRTGPQLVFTGIMLVFVGFLAAAAVVVLIILGK